MNPCIAIPIYDHGETIAAVVESLAKYDLPCLIVDDGSGNATQRELDYLRERYPQVEVIRHSLNRGRGAALRTAYEAASKKGMTHVIQLDADGQHDSMDVPRFLDAAKEHPDALILGQPVFDESIPWHRLHGRKLSRGIVRMETLSKSVRDPLCGFRCIPVIPTLKILEHTRTGDRMDFDPEIVIRLVRAGVPVINIPTKVRYPENGISHFRIVVDNFLIAWAYIRLAFQTSRQRPGSKRQGEKLFE